MASGKDFATVQWLKPESDGGSPLIHYLVERRERKSARWVKVNRDGAHLDTTLKVSGLTEGNIYQFRVTALNKAGESEASEVSLYVVCRVPTCKCKCQPVAFSPFCLDPCSISGDAFSVRSGTPAAPSIPRITDTHADSISLAWSRPVEEGGSEVIGYILEMQVAGQEEWQKAHEKTLRGTEHVVTGLSAATKYHFRVAGVNISGTGDFSDPCAATEPVERTGTTFDSGGLPQTRPALMTKGGRYNLNNLVH